MMLIKERENPCRKNCGRDVYKRQAGDMISVVASPVNASRFFKTIGIETNQVKNTMIIGGGKISFYLAKRLLEMGIQVKIIEKDRDACERLCEILPKAMIINGDGTDRELLAEEGLAKAEGFAALTNMDEENVMLALYAKSMSKAKKITKVNRNTFDTIIGSLNIGSLIYPKHITSETVSYTHLSLPSPRSQRLPEM